MTHRIGTPLYNSFIIIKNAVPTQRSTKTEYQPFMSHDGEDMEDKLSIFRTFELLEELEHYLDSLVGPELRIPLFQALATIHLAIYTHELKSAPRGRQEEPIDSVSR